MKDAKTLAYINLFAVLGAIPYLCDLEREAAELIKNKSVSVGFAVKGGPEATLFFGSGKCRMAPGVDRMVMLLAGEENIREVIAFPLNSNAQDMLLGAPTAVTEQQLREAHIRIR